MDEGYFVGWGTLALINAGIAQAKNRSGLNWFLISLLLGPIATLSLVIFEKLPYSDGQAKEKITLERCNDGYFIYKHRIIGRNGLFAFY